MRANLQIAVGSFTGDATDNRNITTVGFQPDFVLCKSDTQTAMFRTRTMRGDSSGYTVGGTANGANFIQELLTTGFQVGSAANVNGNTKVVYWVAIRATSAQSYCYFGAYTGTGGDNLNVTYTGINFTPTILVTKGDTTQQCSARFGNITGDNCTTLSNGVGSANQIQNFQANGFQLGTNGRANTASVYYHFFAMRDYLGVIKQGTFTGNGADNRSITGIGFQPDVVILKNRATTDAAVLRTSAMSGDLSGPLTGATAADLIQSLDLDGFTVGTAAAVNGSTNAIDYICLKAGNFALPVTRTAV